MLFRFPALLLCYLSGHFVDRKLTFKEFKELSAEVIALQDMGHKRLALETGEDPVNNPME